MRFHISSTREQAPDFTVNHALHIEDLNVSNRYCSNQVDLSEWPHLKDVKLPNHLVDVSEVFVLIGQAVPQTVISSSTIAGAMIHRTSRMRPSLSKAETFKIFILSTFRKTRRNLRDSCF